MGLGIQYHQNLLASDRYQRYLSQLETYQGATQATTNAGATNTLQTDVYQSGISDAGFGANKCTDGKDDGKIGLFSALGNAVEGIGKGFVNGITGALGFGKDANGKTTWNPFKALGTIAIGAACIACPAVGAIACGVGAVMGGVQVAKGASAAMNAKTDAEAKAAWENMGEGGATVVGCMVGAKASVGAMKGASTAAIDDAIKGLDNVDDVAKALKGIDKTNIDDVATALNNAGIDNVDDVTKAISSLGENTSALSQVDDSLKGLDAMKAKTQAFAKDAVSSSKNNAGKIWTKAKETTADYKADYKNYKEAKKQYKDAKKSYDIADETLKDLDAGKIEDAPPNLRKTCTEQMNDSQVKMTSAEQNMNDTKIGGYKNRRSELQQAKKDLSTEQKVYDKAVKKEAKAAKKAKRDVVEPDDSNLVKAQNRYNAAKDKTAFGKLTNKVKNTETGNYLKQALSQDEQASVLKNIKNIKPKDLGGALSKDGQAILSFLQSGEGTYAQAVQEFGYDNVMEVLKVAFAYGQTNSIV